ncbi:OV39 antigen [Ditylenchus destructor]|uniref:OV39 antigen n=1 Tax=Ditylenchus destructor TaxID=166010 RepID=A0AAD4R2R2_9BILA|nr:OV39 antigen [Ditylenchus destructor]
MALLLFSSIICATIAVITSCNCGPKLPQDPFDPLGDWHQRHLECGIPPFAYRLPQDAQSKIHAIWIKYEAGDDCEEQLDATNEVIRSIPEETRMQAFKGMCGPGFLKNESNDVRQEFQKLWFDENLSIEQKQTEFKRLAAQKLSGSALTKFESFNKVFEEHKKERQQIIDAMSAAGREAYNKWRDMRKGERTFLASLPADIRAELGLVCKCCGGCKTGKPRASRSVPPKDIGAEHLEGALKKSDAHILHQASEAECVYLY